MRTNANQNTYLMHFKEALQRAKANLKVIKNEGIPDEICNNLAMSICDDLEAELKAFKKKWTANWDTNYPKKKSND